MVFGTACKQTKVLESPFKNVSPPSHPPPPPNGFLPSSNILPHSPNFFSTYDMPSKYYLKYPAHYFYNFLIHVLYVVIAIVSNLFYDFYLNQRHIGSISFVILWKTRLHCEDMHSYILSLDASK